MTDAQPMIEAAGVIKNFRRKTDLAERIAMRVGLAQEPGTVHALDDVSLSIRRGEVVGLVGESGCGKSTFGRAVAGMLPLTGGVVRRNGQDIAKLKGAEARAMRLATQIIFQDPMSSLNPRKKVLEIIGEAPRLHGLVARGGVRNLVEGLMDQVGLDPAMINRYPHQFSGGQRQRIGIARALAVNPDFLICDESIAALDVSIQAQVINLLVRLRQDLSLTLLFISHDLSVVRYISDRVVIMYLGRVVESAPTDRVFAAARHPYTQALLEEIPRIDRRGHRFSSVKGEIPSPMNPPGGCHFHPRCPLAMDRCRVERPMLKQAGRDHAVACHLDGGFGRPKPTLFPTQSTLQAAESGLL
ncbi:ABC transporter ATP-binding protein [Pseudooceanicola sediminis]|uniref:ABC transporter ATP-binding protein n=1 Tax=Pseudooceanicola sediminis TaxID=2211117 RepID=A0A399J978_9RHOB|nr:ABC transporter ATP-binding protein [Pseudooceanicola sediminis]KAA2316295.1 ABC transporter ATP-binding protein [Puniceibacterium sp. HSS470]RII39206.1 ABC transporter ATP-binding protein [Pseudooceanicola sediminis]|tara:strand:- start:29177 stop:30247 length:1071 start_codon:yes stop_codon:yes gene_type:complete